MKEAVPDLLLIDKPKGITSFDVIRQLQWKYRDDRFKNFSVPTVTPENPKRKLKAGHAGTLDPLATGLMLIGINKGTKLLTGLVTNNKEYVADILLGQKRSTGDMEGIVLEQKKVEEQLSDDLIVATLTDMVGVLRLPVSAYSAIKKNGVPMYKRARAAEKAGEQVQEVPVRDMQVLEAQLLETYMKDDVQIVKVRFLVGSGTYIRSLAEAFGVRVGYPATLQDLRRTKVGKYSIEDAYTLDEI